MKILIINDDGIDAPGIRTLINSLKGNHDLYVAAPHEGMSAMGHAITLKKPVHVQETAIEGVIKAYRIWGTPADCAKLALIYLFKDIAFDVVLSGINNGGNIGTEVIYSGTFAAAHEAHRLGCNAIAISLTNPKRRKEIDFMPSAQHFAKVLHTLCLTKPYFYNINYPVDVLDHQLRLAIPGDVRYQELIHCETTESGMDISFDGWSLDHNKASNTDYKLLNQGYATIVPIGIRWEDPEMYKDLKMYTSIQ